MNRQKNYKLKFLVFYALFFISNKLEVEVKRRESVPVPRCVLQCKKWHLSDNGMLHQIALSYIVLYCMIFDIDTA